MKAIPTQMQRSISRKVRQQREELEMILVQSEVRTAAVLQRRLGCSRSDALRAAFKLHRAQWSALRSA